MLLHLNYATLSTASQPNVPQFYLASQSRIKSVNNHLSVTKEQVNEMTEYLRKWGLMWELCHSHPKNHTMKEDTFFNSKLIRDLEAFKELSNVTLANRWSDELRGVEQKIYTRDLFFRD